jgi:acetylornithine deacetylase
VSGEPDVVAIASRLIGFDTTVHGPGHPPRQERDCQRYVGELLEAAGFEVEIWEPPVAELHGHPMYLEGQTLDGKPVLVATLEGTGGGRSLLLNGHIDTVPAGDRDAWAQDPWQPTIRDGRLYGRGACDMKGGVAAMLAAAIRIAAGERPRGDLSVMVVPEEEINGMGTIAGLARGHRADAAVVPEPTSLDIWVAFRGILVGELEVLGRKGHVEITQPHWSRGGGVNAVHEMARLIGLLRELDAEWRDRPDKQHPLCSTGEVNVTTIAGGDFFANIPERCVASLDICYVPGEEESDGYGGAVKREIEQRLEQAASDWLRTVPPRLRWLVDFPPGEISPQEPVVTGLTSVLAAAGLAPAIKGLDSWDDTVSLIRAGIPALSFGPGSNDQAHGIDEYVPLADLTVCAEAIAAFATRWCNEPATANRESEIEEKR